MIKPKADTAGYVSISGRKIAAILLILFCSFVLAWAGRGGKGNISVKRAQPSMAHTNQAPMSGRPMSGGHVSPATLTHSTATGQAHRVHRQGALSNFKPHIIKSSRVAHSKGAGQGANQGAGGDGVISGSGLDATASPSPSPEESPSLTLDTTDTTLDLERLAEFLRSVGVVPYWE
jgi:hypothetical protein